MRILCTSPYHTYIEDIVNKKYLTKLYDMVYNIHQETIYMHIVIFFLISLVGFATDHKVAGLDPAIIKINQVLAPVVPESVLHQEVYYRVNQNTVTSLHGKFLVGCHGGTKKELNIVFSSITSKDVDEEIILAQENYNPLGLQNSIGIISSDQLMQQDLVTFFVRRVRSACEDQEKNIYLRLNLWSKPGEQRRLSAVKIPEVVFNRLK